MNDKVLWGIIMLGYIAPFCGYEIYRQAALGEGYEIDRFTAVGASGLLTLLGLWAIKVPAAVVILLLLVAGVVTLTWYTVRALRARRAR